MSDKKLFKKRPENKINKYGKTILSVWRTFCERTSLHGMKYIGDSNIMIAERLFWGIAFISAVLFSIYFVHQIYHKYSLNPVIMSINPVPVTTDEIPFPAIKFCNMNQAKRNVVEEINQKRSLEKPLLQYLCDTSIDVKEINHTLAVEADAWNRLVDLLKKTSQSREEMFKSCSWNSKEIDCTKVLHGEVTDEGLCYTFNGLPYEFVYRDGYVNYPTEPFNYPADAGEWNPEIGYKDYRTPKYPTRAGGSGSNYGLKVVLDADLDNYYCSSTMSAGFKVLLYVPSDNSKIKNFAHLVPATEETQITVTPTIYDADFSLKYVDVDKRGCFFREERQLKYFRYYSSNNCKLECESNYTNDHCGCIPFHLPRDKSEALCLLIQLDCAHEAKEIMNEIETNTLNSKCKCLPNCYEIEYNINFSYGTLSKSVNISGIRNNEKGNVAIISIFFGDNHFNRYTKRIIYSFPDFLSSIGGLLGLFLGLSWLSIMEVFYYVMKLVIGLYKTRKEIAQVKARRKKANLLLF